ADMLNDRVVDELTITEQMGDILADLLWGHLIGWSMEIPREIFDRTKISSRGSLGVIATLEFLEHLLSKMGHKDLLVTRTISPTNHLMLGVCVRKAPAARLRSSKVAGVRKRGRSQSGALKPAHEPGPDARLVHGTTDCRLPPRVGEYVKESHKVSPSVP